MKKVILALVGVSIIASLVGCGAKTDKASVYEGYTEFLNGTSSANYSVRTEISMNSNIYGEDFAMSWDSTDNMGRVLSTGDFASERNVKADALENKYEEKITNYVVAGERYATYDGTAFFKTPIEQNPNLRLGVFNIMSQILADDEVYTNSEEYDGQKTIKASGYIEGSFLPYLYDSVNMTGLLDFKSSTDQNIKMEYMLWLNNKDYSPIRLSVSITGMEGIFGEVISGMQPDSGSINTKVNNFYINYYFNDFNKLTNITLPDGAANATETADIDSLSIGALQGDTLDTESDMEIDIAGFKFTITDAWEAVDTLGGLVGYDGVASDGKSYQATKLKYKLSESDIEIMNPVNQTVLVNELAGLGVDTTGMVLEDGTVDTAALSKAVTDYDNTNGYASVYIENDSAPYVMSTKGDTNKEYKFTVFGGQDFLRFVITTDGSELYNDYYNEVISKIADTLQYTAPVVEDVPEETSESTEENGDETQETSESAEETTTETLVGTLRNPYGAKETFSMKGIDLSSGNIVNESAVVNNIVTDELLVEQALKQYGFETDGKAGIVNITVTVDKVQNTEGSSADLIISLSLVDSDGNNIGEPLNDGKPLEKEYADKITFTQDGESKTIAFAFEMTDDFSEEEDLLKIQYNDPDLGNRDIYVKLK